MRREQVDFLGMAFDRLTMDQAVARIEGFIREGRPRKIFCPNVALFVWARSNPFLRRFYESCDLLTPDGMGIYYASRLLRCPVPEMVSAVFLAFRLLERAAAEGYRVYLLGTKPEILERAVANLRHRYPTLVLAGWHHGYFMPEEEEAVAAAVARARPGLLFLGMSSPRKEEFADRYLERMGVPVTLGVGGTLDVIAGVYRLAPGWMRRAGLEWFYRLLQEPRRMWKRYATTNSVFVWLVVRAWVRRRLGRQMRHTSPTARP